MFDRFKFLSTHGLVFGISSFELEEVEVAAQGIVFHCGLFSMYFFVDFA